jgi:hypothetical protein
MNKIRRSIAIMALVVATVLSGLSLQVFGSVSQASAASSHHVNASSTVALKIHPPCGNEVDC